MTWRTFHSGQYEDRAYDNRGRLTSVTLKNSSHATLRTESYTYQDNSNVATHVVDSVTTTYGYDDIDQLTSEARTGYSASYTYDANGNRLTRTVGGVTENYAYDDADKLDDIKIGGVTVKDYSYDAAGRTTSVVSSAGTTTLSWSYDNRLTGITYPNTSTNSFGYNGLGTRISKTDSGGTRTFKRDGAGVTAPVVADGFASYTPGVSERRSGTTTYQHSGLKNNAAQTGTGQTVGATRTYDAFGNVVASTGTFKGPFGYAGPFGYQEDGDSGLKLLGHRYYDSSTGRFLTRDPVKDGRNWYVYCDSNPLTRSDATGGFWDTLLDIASVVLSAIDFIEDPSWETGGGLLVDGIALILPGIPAPGIIRHADDIVDGIGDIGRRLDDLPGGGGGACFAAGTQIVLADGSTKNVEDVEVGDLVLTRDQHGTANAPLSQGQVTRVFERESQDTLLLRFEDGQTVETTDEHPFYVRGKGFLPASHLALGDRIAEAASESTVLVLATRLTHRKTVYNLEVEDSHTYFVQVGDDALWVHNKCDPWVDHHGSTMHEHHVLPRDVADELPYPTHEPMRLFRFRAMSIQEREVCTAEKDIHGPAGITTTGGGTESNGMEGSDP